MKLYEMKRYLKKHGVEDGSCYTHGGLGGGDIVGIEQIDGEWYTYFSERGSKGGYEKWATEDDAVNSILDEIISLAKQYKYWKD